MNDEPKIPGHIMMAVPSVTPEQAINNFDEIVREFACNRETRMALEQSVRVLRDLVEAEAKCVTDPDPENGMAEKTSTAEIP